MHDTRFVRPFAALAAAIFALQLPAAAMAATPAAAPPTMDDAIAAIEAYAPAAMAYQGTPGLSVAITDRGKTVKIITLGYANVDAKAPVTPDTRFAIGSITKSMTALALMQLHDAGKLDFNATVQHYLPWFSIDSGGKPILVHQILSHSAGIPDDYSSESGSVYDVVALQKAKVLFPPGTAWSYSNDGIATAGAILTRLDGRTWPQSLQARVFDALGMSASFPVFTPEIMKTAAIGYQWRDNDRPGALHPPLVASPPIDFVDPAGSVLSTPEDMAQYIRFYLNGGKTASGKQLVSPATFEQMTTADKYNNGKPAGDPNAELAEAPTYYKQYGFGLSIFNENGDHLIGHTGGISGYTACMQANLTRGFGVIAMANLVEAPLHPCAIMLYAMAVLRAQSEGKPLPPAPVTPDPRVTKSAAAYAGTYTSPAGKALKVVADGTSLSLVDGAATIALYPRGDDAFWADDPHYAMYLIAFGRNAKKQVVELTYGSQWFPNERYSGPRTFAHPPSWDALVGRYENTYLGQPYVNRVLIVKNELTLDGLSPLKPLKDGTFTAGGSILRFDAFAGKQPQRLNIDDTHLYRIELP
jgi:CubicO group peptidase (beta-lactamase class C family)